MHVNIHDFEELYRYVFSPSIPLPNLPPMPRGKECMLYTLET